MSTLTNDDFASVAEVLGCSVPAIKAVVEVEGAGSGFLPDGRPAILFEAHVFHRLTNGQYDESHDNISSPTWNRKLYGAPGAHQWDRMAGAIHLNEPAALKSASWGMFQLMGENHRACGFPTIQEFVKAMKTGQREHLLAFSAFVRSNSKLHDALVSRHWIDFAQRYNGPRFAENDYHNKLINAYDRLMEA